jgi:uncharacterized protein
LSSDGRQADAANLIRNNNSDVIKKEEKDDDIGSGVYPTTAFIGRMSSGILSSCLSNGIASKALIISTPRGIPDPDGAAILIESLTKVTDKKNFKIDTQQLRDQGASLKKSMEKIIQSFVEQQQRQEQQQGEGQAPVQTREGVMYG